MTMMLPRWLPPIKGKLAVSHGRIFQSNKIDNHWSGRIRRCALRYGGTGGIEGSSLFSVE